MSRAWLVSLLFMACLGLSGTVGAATLTEGQLAAHNHYTALQGGDGGGSGTQAFEHIISVGGQQLLLKHYRRFSVAHSQSGGQYQRSQQPVSILCPSLHYAMRMI